MSSRRLETGSDSGKVIGGSGLAGTGLRAGLGEDGFGFKGRIIPGLAPRTVRTEAKPCCCGTIPAMSLVFPHTFVPWFRSVAPYIHAYRGETFVVGMPGELVAAGKLNAFVQDL